MRRGGSRIGHISNVIGSRAGDDDDDSGQDPLEIAGAYNVTATVVAGASAAKATAKSIGACM